MKQKGAERKQKGALHTVPESSLLGPRDSVQRTRGVHGVKKADVMTDEFWMAQLLCTPTCGC